MSAQATAGLPQRNTIFISYSKADGPWKDRVAAFFQTLEVWGEAEVWADNRIDTGADWYEAIREAIGRSAVAILLVTKDFLRTDFIAKQEIPDLLARREQLGLKLVPLLVHDCPWNAVRWLRQLQMAPPKGQPLDRLSETDQDSFLSRLVEEIAAFLADWTPRLPTSDSAQGQVKPKSPSVEPANLSLGGVDFDDCEPPFEFDRRGVRDFYREALPIAEVQVDTTHLPATGWTLFGRDAQLDQLDAAWDAPEHNLRVIALVANGGVGKSTLVNRWLRDLEADRWRGATHVFGWSFYSQGAHEQNASAELFIDQALRFFGDPHPETGSPWEKGERLARLTRQQRSLLVLDGLEPLQSPHAFERGRLRDPGLQALLRGLAREGQALCVVTTREPVVDLAGHEGFVAIDLDRLTPQDGRALLRSCGVAGSDPELETLATEFGPHALSLALLGSWLHAQPGQHASAAANLPRTGEPLARILAGFERWLGAGAELELLRLQGLFARPAPAALWSAVRGTTDIPGLVEHLPPFSQSDAQRVTEASGDWGPWRTIVQRLRELRLMAPSGRSASDELETHPLVRAYFAAQVLADTAPPVPEVSAETARYSAWQEAQRRLYEHLTKTTAYRPDTLAGLQPLYQAVAHGCQAGLHQQACVEVYRERILRGTGKAGFYSRKKFGSTGADLGAVACFFDRPWSRVSPNLSPADQAWLLNQAAVGLRGLGRLAEAVEPMRLALEMRIEQQVWISAAIIGSNLSELELTLGNLAAAVAEGQRAVSFADHTRDWSQRMINRTTLADALHQIGRRDEALALFRAAEALQAWAQPQFPRLYSLQGFQYCELLLSAVERAAWQVTWAHRDWPSTSAAGESAEQLPHSQVCAEVSGRAQQELERRRNLPTASILDLALNHLTLARAGLYEALLTPPATHNLPPGLARPPTRRDVRQQHLAAALDGLRASDDLSWLPLGLLTLAWDRFVEGDRGGSQEALAEAWELAERGPMPLFQADVHLTRACLFGDRTALAEARRLIEAHGYHRRDEELAGVAAALARSH